VGEWLAHSLKRALSTGQCCGTIGGKGGITTLIGARALLNPNGLLDQASFADIQQPTYEDDLDL
jgi:hypothetical protein